MCPTCLLVLPKRENLGVKTKQINTQWNVLFRPKKPLTRNNINTQVIIDKKIPNTIPCSDQKPYKKKEIIHMIMFLLSLYVLFFLLRGNNTQDNVLTQHKLWYKMTLIIITSFPWVFLNN